MVSHFLNLSVAVRTLFILLLLTSCGSDRKPADINESGETTVIPEFEMATISVDLSGKNVLAILLAKDGTINRKGSANLDSSDRVFFMGVTKQPLMDSVNASVTNELLTYSDIQNNACDTTLQVCRIELTFANRKSEKQVNYCVQGTFDDLPAPIRAYISNVIRITDPWYMEQQQVKLPSQ